MTDYRDGDRRDRDRDRDDRGSDPRSRDRGDRDRDLAARRDDRRDTDRDRGSDRDRDDRGRGREPEEDVEPGRAVFVGNIEQYCRVEDLEDLFSQKGPVNRVDLKQGYAFVFMESGQREAVRAFDGYHLFGRRLKVELARGDGIIKKREDQRRREALQKPCETLFVVNFDSIATQHRDLEKAFGRYGEIKRIEMKRNFAFVQFATVDEATKALEALNGSKLQERAINVEFVARGHDDSKGFSRKRDRSPSPARRRESPPRRRYRSRSPSPRARPAERYGDRYRGGGGGGNDDAYGRDRDRPSGRDSRGGDAGDEDRYRSYRN